LLLIILLHLLPPPAWSYGFVAAWPSLLFILFYFILLYFYSIVSCHNNNWTSGHHILLPSVAHPPEGGRAGVSNHMGGPICVSCSLDSFNAPIVANV
jgi:hypothetical protein